MRDTELERKKRVRKDNKTQLNQEKAQLQDNLCVKQPNSALERDKSVLEQRNSDLEQQIAQLKEEREKEMQRVEEGERTLEGTDRQREMACGELVTAAALDDALKRGSEDDKLEQQEYLIQLHDAVTHLYPQVILAVLPSTYNLEPDELEDYSRLYLANLSRCTRHPSSAGSAQCSTTPDCTEHLYTRHPLLQLALGAAPVHSSTLLVSSIAIPPSLNFTLLIHAISHTLRAPSSGIPTPRA
ncbi:hypothetical protein BGX38DRAFT_1267638 [Terfezia claveryi]|nr:hypothetical protein BGX38DRAFT_1267638 [Terfezia claveryi]